MNLALTLLRPAPFIESGTTKQRSPRCAAAVIITSCASVTLPLIQEARTIRAPHQDEPRIGQSQWGGWVTGARRAASNSDTNASFRTESQSFLRGWRDCIEKPGLVMRLPAVASHEERRSPLTLI